MTYSPTATGPGQTGYWGDTYGSSAVSNQFIVGRWKILHCWKMKHLAL